MKTNSLPIALLMGALGFTCAGQEWIPLFDGATMNGWEPSENKTTWRVENGALVSHGARSHLFYTGGVHQHDFKNFEVKADVMTLPGSNSGLYIHTHYQETGFPETGYECQVINSNRKNQPAKYVEHKMTASIYAIRNVWKAPVPDNAWFTYRVVVQGKTIRTYINDELMAEYTESEKPFRVKDKAGRLLSSGTFALQGHDAGSVVSFRNIAVKPLPDDLPTPGTPTDDPAFDAQIIQLANDNFPLLDLDVRLTGGLTLEQALANSRKFGYTYGFVFDGALPADFRKPPQAYAGVHVQGNEKPGALADASAAGVDYVIADLAAPGDVTDAEQFVDGLVKRLGEAAQSKRMKIWARATAVPPSLKATYAAVWSPERMDRVIAALKEGDIAVEINDRLRTPSAAFIQRAKAAGVRFAFGSDDTNPHDLGKLAYCVAMIKECHLGSGNLWIPGKE